MPRVFQRRDDATVLRAINTLPCPKCDAAVGVRCSTPKGAVHNHTHRARVLAYFKSIPQTVPVAPPAELDHLILFRKP